MGNATAKIQLAVAFAALFAVSALAGNGDSTQVDSQVINYKTNDTGSDDSLRNSSVYAMQALMDLAGGKIPGAVKNGYNAYGKYRTAENLDRLKDMNAMNANLMGSAGSAPVLSTARTNTSFRRLDMSFLHQGDADKVAAEFEKETGMKRETFLTQMADISEQKIKGSDPMMIDKAFSRFENFLQKIPNKDFRKNAEKSIALVPDTMRRGMVAQAVQKLAGMFADAGPAALPVDSTITDAAKNKLADAAKASPAGAAGQSTVTDAKDAKKNAAGNEGRDPSSIMDRPLPPLDLSLNGGSGKNGAEGAVAAALAAQGLGTQSGDGTNGDGFTIFQQVTKRYRILTPVLIKTP